MPTSSRHLAFNSRHLAFKLNSVPDKIKQRKHLLPHGVVLRVALWLTWSESCDRAVAQTQSPRGRKGCGATTKEQENVHLEMSAGEEASENLNLCIVTLPPFQTLKLGQELHISDAMQNVK